MSKIKWNSGPPPHVGWWKTKTNQLQILEVWRWWNGEHWSFGVFAEESADHAAKWGSLASSATPQWCDHWPENARVPRIDPR